MSKFWEKWSLDKLEDAIRVLDRLFYDGQTPIYDGTPVSNTDYDFMRMRLQESRPESSVFTKVSHNKRSADAGTVKHSPPFCSLSKINREKEEDKYVDLIEWLNDRQHDIGWDNFDLEKSRVLPMFTQSYKLDGVALRIYYEKGKLVKAGLRPEDGITAEDVSENVKYVEGIPQTLSKPYTLSVTGEVICRISDFNKINEKLAAEGKKLRANPRNHTAGALRLFKEPKKTKEGKLRFIGYSIENFEGKLPYKDEMQRAIWSNTVLGVPFVQVRPLKFNDLKAMEENVKNLDYEVDGVVIAVRNLEEQEQCGRHGSGITANPKGKIAWKFKENHADVKVEKIIWQVGRTGRVIPVLTFEGVSLAGTTVTRATGHNLGFLERSGIGVGTIVRIIKSGKIIPKVIAVMSGKKKKVSYPERCPCCEEKLLIAIGGKVKNQDETNKDLACENDNCPAKNTQSMLHYVQTFGVKGIGEATVMELIDLGIVTELHHFYQLTEADFEYTDLSERQTLLALADIHMIPNPSKVKNDDELRDMIKEARNTKKQIKAGRFLAALGIPNVAEVTGDALITHFKTLENVMGASLKALSDTPDVGEKTAASVVDYFFANKKQTLDLLKYVELELPKQGTLTGKTFVLSGALPGSKEHWKSQIEERGGTVKGSVGSSTDYLVAGEGSGSKSDKAKSLGIPIIDTDELEKILKKS